MCLTTFEIAEKKQPRERSHALYSIQEQKEWAGCVWNMSTSSGGKRLGSKGFLGREHTTSSGSSQALHPELAAAGIQGEEGGIGGGEDGGGGGRGEARGAGEGSARGGWAGANAGLRELSGRLRRAARAAAPARSELPEPGCVSIRSYKLRARSQQGDGPASVLSGRWDSRCLGLPPLDPFFFSLGSACV